MKSLILDTSSEWALLAVVEDDYIHYKLDLPSGPLLSKSLGSEVKKLIEANPPPYGQMIVGIGPGSFTGIRVGVSMAQALSFGWQIPLCTASSLAGFLPVTDPTSTVALDARSGGIYVQCGFEAPQLFSLAEAAHFLSKTTVIASPHPSRIIDRLPNLSTISWLQTRPNPLHLLRCAVPCSYPLKLHYLSTP